MIPLIPSGIGSDSIAAVALLAEQKLGQVFYFFIFFKENEEKVISVNNELVILLYL
jgi:hypothetical protein